MKTDSSKCVLNIRTCPTELRRRLKIKAASREIDLQDLVVEYLQFALDRDFKGIEGDRKEIHLGFSSS
jgi:hypothetical protein